MVTIFKVQNIFTYLRSYVSVVRMYMHIQRKHLQKPHADASTMNNNY